MSGWKRWLIPGAALPVLGLLAFGLTRDVREIPSPLPGKPAPDFRLATLSDPADSLGMEDLRGRVTIVNFWASWCIPCRAEHAVLVRASNLWSEDRVKLVGVLYQDSPANARRFMERLGGDWPTLLDPGIRTAIEFGVYGVPETYILRPDGRVAYKHTGPITWDVLQAEVQGLLAAADSAPGDGRPGEAAGGRAGGDGDPGP